MRTITVDVKPDDETRLECDLCGFVAERDEMADHFYERHYSTGQDWVLNVTEVG